MDYEGYSARLDLAGLIEAYVQVHHPEINTDVTQIAALMTMETLRTIGFRPPRRLMAALRPPVPTEPTYCLIPRQSRDRVPSGTMFSGVRPGVLVRIPRVHQLFHVFETRHTTAYVLPSPLDPAYIEG